MNKIWIVFVACLVGCASLEDRRSAPSGGPEVRDVEPSARGDDAGLRHRVLLLPFLDERQVQSTAVAEAARQTVLRDLRATRQLVIVSPDEFPQDPKKFMTEGNEYDLAALAKLASAMGIAAVIEGKVLSLKAKRVGDSVGLIRETHANVASQIRVRVFAGKNGKEVLNETRSAETEATARRVGTEAMSLNDDPELARAAIRKALGAATPGILRAIDKLNWQGRVAMVNGERVFLNAGRISGLQVGDILKISEEGDDVYDPDSGRFIGAAPGRLKGTVEVVSYFGKDGAIAVIHSGSGFAENDRVELY